MLFSDVIKHYGSRAQAVKAITEAFNITRAAVYQWGELVPPRRAMELERLTGGALRYDPALYVDWNKPKRRAEECAA